MSVDIAPNGFISVFSLVRFQSEPSSIGGWMRVLHGQGCKVGLGGHLMGQKVTDQVAEMRSLPAGIDQRSPARHPDWLVQTILH